MEKKSLIKALIKSCKILFFRVMEAVFFVRFIKLIHFEKYSNIPLGFFLNFFSSEKYVPYRYEPQKIDGKNISV